MAIVDTNHWSNSLALNFNGANGSTTFTDISPTTKTPSVVGGNAQLSTTSPKFGSASLLLDGTGDYLEYASNAAWDFGSGDFTIDLWWTPTGATTDYSIASLAVAAGTVTSDISWNIFHGGSSSAGKVTISICASSTAYSVVSLAGLNAGQTYHIEAVRASGTLYLFIDGALQGSTPANVTLNTTAGRVMRIGRYTNGLTRDCNGKIDDFRITKGVARHVAAFTPPTDEFTVDTTRTVNVNVSMPMPTAQVETGVVIDVSMPALIAVPGVQVAVSMPMPTVEIQAGATIEASMPMPTVRMEGRRTVLNTIDVAMPMPTVEMREGHRIAAAMPMPTLEMSGTTTILISIQATMPMPTLEMSGTSTGSVSVSAALPMPTVEMQGGSIVQATMPMPTVQMEGTTGSVIQITATMPMASVQCEISADNTMQVSATMPMLLAGPWGRITAFMPMAQVQVVARSVVVVTYEAYAVNLQPSAGFRESAVHEVTRFDAWEFDHVIRWRNRYYGVKADGLYLLGGNLDGADAIAWELQSGMSKMGSSQKKAAREMFVHGRVGAGLTASVTLKGDDSTNRSYDAIVQAGGDAEATRVKIGQGLKSVYWSYGLADPDGGVADIDSIELNAAELSRKVF